MTDDQTISLDEILTRAVDRQIAEQRALRQALDELKDTVKELTNRPAARVDLTPLEERIQDSLTPLSDRIQSTLSPLEDRVRSMLTPLEDRLQLVLRSLTDRSETTTAAPDLSGLEDRIRSAMHGSVAAATESSLASLSDQLRAFREVVVPRLEQATEANAAVRSMSDEIGSIREVVSGVSTDLEGIAQALIDFNSGLRGWASGLDETVGSIRLTVGELYAVATQPSVVPSVTKASDDTDAIAKTDGKSEPPAGIEERIKETAELSEYLADQIEDLDGLMGRLSELPPQLEGVVSQALKRTLTARAKLDREAESALDDVLEALDEHVGQLTSVLERFQQEEDHIRKIALEQVELTSRIESLQSTFIDRIDRIDNERRRGEEAIAVAIDRSHRGLAPRALESLSKSTRRRKAKPEPKPKPASKKATRKATSQSAAKRQQPQRKAKRTARKPKRQDWTPLPDLSDDTRD